MKPPSFVPAKANDGNVTDTLNSERMSVGALFYKELSKYWKTYELEKRLKSHIESTIEL